MHTEAAGRTAGEVARAGTEEGARELNERQEQIVTSFVKSELYTAYDLPELSETLDEADARVAASRYLGAMRAVEAEHGANEDEYKTLAAFQQRRHDKRQGPLVRQLIWLDEAVKTLFVGFMRPTGKKKSLNLIGGRVGMRAQTDELVVDHVDAVIAWAKEKNFTALVRTKPTLDRTALRTFMIEGAVGTPKATFPSPPGCRLEKRPDQFYATPAKD